MLPVDLAAARRGAALHAPDPRPVRDAPTAAALARGLRVGARDVADVDGTGVDVLDPWKASEGRSQA